MTDRPTHIRITEAKSCSFTTDRVYPVSAWRDDYPCVDKDDQGEAASVIWSKWEPAEPPVPTAAPDVSNTATSGSVAHSILTEAAGIVQGDRNATHGDKERSFQVIADLWNAYQAGRKTPGPLTPRDVAQMMVLLKIARTIQGTAVRDHFTDAAGYSAIAGELS